MKIHWHKRAADQLHQVEEYVLYYDMDDAWGR